MPLPDSSNTLIVDCDGVIADKENGGYLKGLVNYGALVGFFARITSPPQHILHVILHGAKAVTIKR